MGTFLGSYFRYFGRGSYFGGVYDNLHFSRVFGIVGLFPKPVLAHFSHTVIFFQKIFKAFAKDGVIFVFI